MPFQASKALIPTLLRTVTPNSDDAERQMVLANMHKILLIKQSERLGNIVLMNSGISGLAMAFPGIKIDLLLPAGYVDIMKGNEHINIIIPVQKRQYIYMPWKLIQLIAILRARKYDLAIDCSDVHSHSSTGASYALLAGARIVAGWKTGEKQLFDIEIPRYAEQAHATEMYIKLFSGIFGKEICGEPYFDNFTAKSNSPTGSVVGINCGGRGTKRWPLENFVKVGSQLATLGLKVDFILGPEEKSLREQLRRSLPYNCDLLPLLPLAKFMDIISSYRVFISSDTGPMHLAWCLKVPTIAIFLDSELDKFRPLTPGSVAIDGQNGVAPDDIFNCALKIINSKKVAS
jgi:ADP-heptose:LPS heptosyltransferase